MRRFYFALGSDPGLFILINRLRGELFYVNWGSKPRRRGGDVMPMHRLEDVEKGLLGLSSEFARISADLANTNAKMNLLEADRSETRREHFTNGEIHNKNGS